MSRLMGILVFLPFSMTIYSCSAHTKSCEQDEFASTLLQTDGFEKGLSFLKLSNASFQDIIELKMDQKVSICSGKLTGTRYMEPNFPLHPEGKHLPYENEFTWKVEKTQDGDSFFTWFQGRRPASDLE